MKATAYEKGKMKKMYAPNKKSENLDLHSFHFSGTAVSVTNLCNAEPVIPIHNRFDTATLFSRKMDT